MPPIEIRPLGPGDSLAGLTRLLNRAYAGLLAEGLNFTAATQDEAKTRERVEGNEVLLAVRDGRPVGAVTLVPEWPEHLPPAPGGVRTAFLCQLAVDPDLRRRGLGTRLLDLAEARAAAMGFAAVGLDTAEPAAHLLALYEARGYLRIGVLQWPGKTYRSVVMVKALAMQGGGPRAGRLRAAIPLVPAGGASSAATEAPRPRAPGPPPSRIAPGASPRAIG